MMHIGETIRQKRIAQLKTLHDVAEGADISISYLSDIETGRTEPPLRTLYPIARALGYEIEIVWHKHGEPRAYDHTMIQRLIDELETCHAVLDDMVGVGNNIKLDAQRQRQRVEGALQKLGTTAEEGE